MDKDSLSFSSLVSRESESSLDEDAKLCASEEEEEEYVVALMERETEFVITKDQSLAFDGLVKHARLEAIAWTLKVSLYLNPSFLFSFFFLV